MFLCVFTCFCALWVLLVALGAFLEGSWGALGAIVGRFVDEPKDDCWHHVLCCAVLCCAVMCCAVLCCAVLRCAALSFAVLCCTVLCCPGYAVCAIFALGVTLYATHVSAIGRLSVERDTYAVLCCAVLRCAALRFAVLCRAVLCCGMLRCAALCCTVLCCAVPCSV